MFKLKPARCEACDGRLVTTREFSPKTNPTISPLEPAYIVYNVCKMQRLFQCRPDRNDSPLSINWVIRDSIQWQTLNVIQLFRRTAKQET